MKITKRADQCPLVAHRVGWRGAATGPELGVDRKRPARSQSDAIDPNRKSAPYQGRHLKRYDALS